jgi:hypothetical protein
VVVFVGCRLSFSVYRVIMGSLGGYIGIKAGDVVDLYSDVYV